MTAFVTFNEQMHTGGLSVSHRNPQGGKKGERRMDEAAVRRQAREDAETSGGEEGCSES